MHGRSFRFSLLFLLFFSLSFSVMAKSDDESTGDDEVIPAREQDFDWVLGVCEPRIPETLDPSSSILAEGFMTRFLGLLVNSSAEITRSELEIDGIEQSRIEAASASIQKNLLAKISERDLLLFKGYSNWKYTSLLNKAVASIDEQHELLAIERSHSYAVPEKARLRFHATNEGGTLLSFDKEGDMDSFAATNALDAMLITGMREHYGYLVFSWKLYRRWERAVVMEDEIMFSRHSRDEAADETARLLASRLSGHALSLVAIRSLPSNSHVAIDGRRIVPDQTYILNVGKHHVTVDSEGYHPLSAFFNLAGADSIVLRPDMRPVELSDTIIEVYADESVNQDTETGLQLLGGVSVTLNNEYSGETPLTLALPLGETHILGFSKPGYESRSILYQHDGQARAQFMLPVLQRDKQGVKLSRKAFYKAFGMFFLSVPLAMIATGVHDSYNDALASTGNAVYSTGELLSLISMGALWTGSAVLLGNTVWHFTHYLKASNDSGVEDYNERGK